MYTTTGKILRSNDDQKQGWYRLELDNEISRYYKYFYSLGGKTWDIALNGCHVTFIAGEKESRIISATEMNKYLGLEIEVKYDGIIYTHGRSFWINCESTSLDEIRKELGLGEKYRGYHITLGTWKRK